MPKEVGILIIGIIVISLTIYFLPTIIVIFNKKKDSKFPVIILNLFLGWTFIGWIIALIISLGNDR